MTYADHLRRDPDGEYDLDAAERLRLTELLADPGELERLAAKAVKAERSAWSRTNTARLRKQFQQPALSPELELDALVPLGESVAVELGDMDHDRIPRRKDTRTKTHLDEIRAYDTEMTFWLDTEKVLPSGQTIRDAIGEAS